MRNSFKALAAAAVLSCTAGLYMSPSGLQEVRQHEGISHKAYLDAVNVPTICYGSTDKVLLGYIATDAECNARLQRDVEVAAKGVRSAIKHKLTQEQFNAVTSLTFNVGVRNLHNSTLARKINAGDCLGAAKEFDRWVYAKGKKLKGLVTRRAVERQYWETGCHLWDNRPTESTATARTQPRQ